MKKHLLGFALLATIATAFTSCKEKKNEVTTKTEEIVFNYQPSGDAEHYFFQADSTGSDYFNMYTIWKANTLTFNTIYKITLGGKDITGAKIDSWDAAASGTTAVSTPTAANTFTSGTAFQVGTTKDCFINVKSSLSGLLGISASVKIEISTSQFGTYTEVSLNRLLLSVASVVTDQCSGGIPVGKNQWVKITTSNTGGTLTNSYVKWNI